MSWDFKYVSAACPELTKAEVDVLINQLRSDSRYDSATAISIQELARQLFPDIYRHREAVTNQHVREAIELMERSASLLARAPSKSDEISRSEIELKSNIVWLKNEMGEA